MVYISGKEEIRGKIKTFKTIYRISNLAIPINIYDHNELRTCYTSQDVIRDFKPMFQGFSEYAFV